MPGVQGTQAGESLTRGCSSCPSSSRAPGALGSGRWVKGIVIDDTDLFNEHLREWQDFYNYHRPHGALGGQTPHERLRQKTSPASAPEVNDLPQLHNSTGGRFDEAITFVASCRVTLDIRPPADA